MTIGERIKELRAEADLRQSELGKAIGFSAQVVSNVERGYSFPSTEFVNRSAACFGVPADYILGRTTSRYAVADPKEVSAVQARTKARLAQLQMSLPDLIKKSTLTEETCCDILAGKTVPGIDAAASLSKALDTYIVFYAHYTSSLLRCQHNSTLLLLFWLEFSFCFCGFSLFSCESGKNMAYRVLGITAVFPFIRKNCCA